MRGRTFLCVMYALLWQSYGSGRLGLVLWPGLGDACSSTGLVQLIDKIEVRYGLSVHCIDQGHGGLFGNVDEQISEVCSALSSSLRDGDAGVGYLGFSQGGLFLRVLLQRCESLPAGPLVTLGAPHAGVTSWPSCPVAEPSTWFCSWMDALVIEDLGMTSLARGQIVPASYLYSQDVPAPLLDAANSCDGHLPGLGQLRKRATVFAAFSFEEDTMLEPPESAWFGRWNGDSVVTFKEQDELGCLNDLSFERNVVPRAAHMQLDEAFFFGDIMERYFVPTTVVT
jgi:palmitoyl-protein thioesterase